MIDWITLLIELVGIAILLMWIVIPIREFRQILRVLKNKRAPHPTDIQPSLDSPPARREDGPRI